jgi:ABC-2 type transport system permease protein
MHNWKASWINELYLMVYRRKTLLFLVVSALIPILLTISLRALQPYLGLLAIGGTFPIQVLTIYTAVWIPLFILLITADLFPSEIAARTLKLALLRPNTRLQVFFSKVAALAVGIGFLLILLSIVTLICSLFGGTLGSLSETMNVLKAYAASFVAMIALAAVFVFVSQFFKSASGFIVFSIVLYAAAKLAPFFVRSFSAFSPFSYTNWHMLWINHTVSAGKLISTSLFLVSSSILFFALGYYIFDRKEV